MVLQFSMLYHVYFSKFFFNKCVRIFLYFNYMIINLKLNSYLKSFHDSSF